jgi:RNA polymerase sigma-54 factor
MIRQELSQKLQQKLSPQQIQFMKLLQIPTAALEQRIEEELENNPALEEGTFEESPNEGEGEIETPTVENDFEDSDESSEKEEDYELDEYLHEYMEDDPESYKEQQYDNPDEERKEIPLAVENSFHDYLLQQINLLNLKDEKSSAIARQIIGSIDDDGYLRRDISAIADDILFSYGYNVQETDIQEVLKSVQKLDPPGTGARDLRECLLIQLKHKRDQSATQDPIIEIACKILDKYFLEFSRKHFDKLLRVLNIEDEVLRDVIDEIIKLNPKPASGYNPSKSPNSNYIIPDFIITNRDGELELTLHNQNYPELRVSDRYKSMLKNYAESEDGTSKITRQEKEAITFLKQKIDSAKWFIDSIQKRYNTMYRTMYTIMQAQYDFFLTGDDRKIKPMILKDIADVTGLDISTVSRVANNKYVLTEFGTRKIKDFFSESIQNSDGEEVSTLEVKYLLVQIIQEEDKRNPLSDEDLKEILTEHGFNLARRTIAKYREQLNIPVARMRKIL